MVCSALHLSSPLTFDLTRPVQPLQDELPETYEAHLVDERTQNHGRQDWTRGIWEHLLPQQGKRSSLRDHWGWRSLLDEGKGQMHMGRSGLGRVSLSWRVELSIPHPLQDLVPACHPSQESPFLAPRFPGPLPGAPTLELIRPVLNLPLIGSACISKSPTF